ncbi:MAG: membrane protein insertase YidC [Gemmatimonas sp.]
MDNQRNLILAVAVSVAIMFGFQYFFGKTPAERQQQAVENQQAQQQQPARPDALTPPSTDGQAAPRSPVASAPVPAPTAAPRQSDTGPRIKITTPRLAGSIALKGARFDQLSLEDYRETVDPGSPTITLLAPPSSEHPYFAEYGWLAQDAGVPVPTADTVWQADADTLTPSKPVHLTWDNGRGLVFKRTLSVDDNFLFTIADSVENRTGQAVTLFPYGLIARTGTPHTEGLYILHEGPVGVLGGSLKEVSYKDAAKQTAPVSYDSKGGWIGITDKYWLASLMWDQNAQVKGSFTHRKEGELDKYQTDFLGAGISVPANGSAETTNHLFAGAKEVRLIDAYAEKLGVQHFDLAIDFGWFYFLTKPFFYALDTLSHWFGNFGLAILALTVCVKLVFFPLANKSYRSMSALRDLQPEMQRLRERYKDDRMRMNQAMMELYRKEKVNPAAGCLPIVIQIPVFFALYKVLYVTIEMRHAPFYGWIKDLSAHDPTNIFNLFGLIPWTPPAFLPVLGAWPLIMGLTMFLQMKLNPQPADPVQAKVFMFMPIIFTFILAPFPAGLVIYWAWNNTLSIAQQWIIMRRTHRQKAAAAAAKR